ncbi:winged helix-turn-helix domain-containing protein [Micromonospora sp. RTGN7]|uniref:winged helix-turn-helix domain-containing protein n=1 Tax=Micromonospora sp. RTGN7 TaxID=3016526 RepID=UPI0029FF201A|nr:winged helix-turn-helix domain-containing protein [Micromonospora sp. RTGN7]
MSVVAISPRPHPAGRPDRAPQGRPDRAPTGRVDRVPPAHHLRSAPTLTVTVELAPGQLTPRLARLVELLRELAESGEGTLLAGPPEHRRVAVEPTGARPFTVGPSTGDPDEVHILAGSRVVRQGARVIPLTRIEFDLLQFLAEHPRRVFTRLQLLSNVWGYEHAVARTVDVHVRRLRAKLGATCPLVTTVYGVGYRLADEARVSVYPHR